VVRRRSACPSGVPHTHYLFSHAQLLPESHSLTAVAKNLATSNPGWLADARPVAQHQPKSQTGLSNFLSVNANPTANCRRWYRVPQSTCAVTHSFTPLTRARTWPHRLDARPCPQIFAMFSQANSITTDMAQDEAQRSRPRQVCCSRF
jgi:hypothetical protein